jgi:hypothetical protein
MMRMRADSGSPALPFRLLRRCVTRRCGARLLRLRAQLLLPRLPRRRRRARRRRGHGAPQACLRATSPLPTLLHHHHRLLLRSSIRTRTPRRAAAAAQAAPA